MRLKLAAVALVPFLTSPALAESWYWAGGSDYTQTYVDLDSIRPIGNATIAVTKSIYAEPLCGDGDCSVGSGDIRTEYVCGEGYFRTLEYTYYDLNDEFIGSEPSDTINEHKVPSAGSINEAVMDFVCYRKGGEYVGDPYADAREQFFDF